MIKIPLTPKDTSLDLLVLLKQVSVGDTHTHTHTQILTVITFKGIMITHQGLDLRFKAVEDERRRLLQLEQHVQHRLDQCILLHDIQRNLHCNEGKMHGCAASGTHYVMSFWTDCLAYRTAMEAFG